ncbi:sulfatase-like hydrolase/transferase [Halovenus sp. WSH3]|uniref:Sulfatase-like hydrolase/transferase n=1 Tax=Halovenus carboxidivorans TaxID=2692199 RepID=A0A6B0TCP0_9EURY|nr:sulfatase [Halovenus carboxidivorans]MXR53001.1 sulfatase-like hydrolase/transferase [Halovenus carboxidivorans]
MARKSIVWLSIESLRYDHTTLSGYQRPTTPNLADIAARPTATSFDQCFAHGNWTRTSTTSILSGTHPSSHGVFSTGQQLAPTAVTVPELLSEAGYDTVCFSRNSQIESAIDAEDRFDEYFAVDRTTARDIAGLSGLLKYLLQIRSHGGGFTTDTSRHSTGYLVNEGIKKQVTSEREPVFLYVHYNDTHQPYVPPLPYLKRATAELSISADRAARLVIDLFDNMYELMAGEYDLTDEQRAAMLALYDASIAYTDQRVGAIVEYLRSELDAVVVITGDHGELFGEDDMFAHRIRTHDAVTHVPLVVLGETGVLDYSGPIQHIDVVRTLLREVGVDHEQLEGLDLREDSREYAVTERGGDRAAKTFDRLRQRSDEFAPEQRHRGHLVTLRSETFKYERSDSAERLLELPDESTDVSERYPDVLAEFRERYRTFADEFARDRSLSAEADLSAGVERRLQEMGYLTD